MDIIWDLIYIVDDCTLKDNNSDVMSLWYLYLISKENVQIQIDTKGLLPFGFFWICQKNWNIFFYWISYLLVALMQIPLRFLNSGAYWAYRSSISGSGSSGSWLFCSPQMYNEMKNPSFFRCHVSRVFIFNFKRKFSNPDRLSSWPHFDAKGFLWIFLDLEGGKILLNILSHILRREKLHFRFWILDSFVFIILL